MISTSKMQSRQDLFESIIAVIERPSLDTQLDIALATIKDLTLTDTDIDSINLRKIFNELLDDDLPQSVAVFRASLLYMMTTTCNTAKDIFFDLFLDLSKMKVTTSDDKSDILRLFTHISIALMNVSLHMVHQVVKMCIDGLRIHLDSFGIDCSLTPEFSFALHVLTSLLSASKSVKFSCLGTAVSAELEGIHTNLMAVISANKGLRPVLLKKLAPLVYTLRATFHTENTDIISAAISTVRSLYLTGDIDSFVALMCILVDKFVVPYEYIPQDFWDMLKGAFNSKKSLIRKRCIFLLQKMITILTGNTSSDFGLQEKPKSQRKKTRDDQDVMTSTDSSRWIDLFVDCYGQIEGATQLHLIAQIWPTISSLCRSLRVTEYKEGVNYPRFSFGWLKVLLNMLLTSEVPIIRKAALQRLLTYEQYNMLL